MGVIQEHLRRLLPQRWGLILDDPRRCERSWRFEDLLQVITHSMVSGCKSLREVERLTEASSRRVPDTTLHDLLVQVDAEPLEEELAKGVKHALRNHELDNKELPIRLTVIDGKSLSVTNYEVDGCSINRSQKGRRKFVQHALRAFHGSSTVKLLMAQLRVPKGTNEKGIFPCFLDKLVELYGRTGLLEVFSFDAGFTSIKNAKAIVDHGFHYIFALKDPRIHAVTRAAIALLSNRAADKVETERVNGKEITRSLYRCRAEQTNGWSHATELWRICKVSVDLKTGKSNSEDHYYATNLPRSRLTNANVLKTVRMHWSIENNANWVMDVAWEEDDSPWCNAAIETITLMRMIAYNIVARFKLRRLRRAKAKSWTWEQVLYFIKTALFPVNEKVFADY